jgi:diaminopimelate decarboxylase
MKTIHDAFPEPFFFHHYAVKANPIKSILKVVKNNHFGVECASFGEVENMEYNIIE